MRVLVVLLLLARVAAADSAPTAMSLRQAIDYAHAHQPSLAAARARVDAARAQADVARAAWSPRVVAAAEGLVGTANNTTASYATLGALDIARVGGTPANAPVSWSPDVSTLAGVAVHQEIYDFGRLEAAASAFDQLAAAEAESTHGAELDLDLLVEDSFYAVEASRSVLSSADAAVTRARAHRDLADANVKSQLRPPIDLARAEADLARFEVSRARAAGDVAIAQAELAAAVGYADASLDAGADDVAQSDVAVRVASWGSLDARLPELRAARERLAAQHSITTSIRDELRPDVAFSALLTGRAGSAAVTNATPAGGGFVPDVPNWDALVVITWPLFDRTVDARARVSEQVERERASELDALTQAAHAAVARADVVVDVSRAQLPALQRALDAASENQKQADARFRAGLVTPVELADAEDLLVDAQIQLAIGNLQLQRARARASRARAEGLP